jgi:hypothetical protein
LARAINIVVYLKNMSPTKSLNIQTPFEAFHGYKLEANHLRVFGCKAFAHVPKDETIKLYGKSIKCIFISYCTDKKTYKLFDPSSHKLLASRDVVPHGNANKDDKMNDIGVWNTTNDNDNSMSKFMQMMNKNRNRNRYRFKNRMTAAWTLQATMAHQEEEKSHYEEEEEMKAAKDQGGHHDKLNHQ